MDKEGQNVVEINNVSFSYGMRKVLENVSLLVKQGDFWGLIGPNGSGKTTLLKLILGLIRAESGEICLFGTRINKFRNWSKIGYVPQKVTQFDSRFPVTVEEVVYQGRISKSKIFHRFSKNDKRVVLDSLNEVGMGEYKSRLITELSGGQQQRVFLARALASEPELLVLDEPTVGVDIESQDEFYDLLSRLNKEKKLTLIMVSHDIGVVINEVSRLACINRTLIYHGTPKEFMKKDYLESIYGVERKFILHGH
jgi:zinc transport system ATP-binding protein